MPTFLRPPGPVTIGRDLEEFPAWPAHETQAPPAGPPEAAFSEAINAAIVLCHAPLEALRGVVRL